MTPNTPLIVSRLIAQVTPPDPSPTINYVETTQDVLDSFNPLLIENSPVAAELATPGGIISRLIAFIFPLAGLAMFVLLIVAGFEIMGAAATKKSIDTGKQRATAAVVGFILLFASYWIVRILEMVFNLKILGS